jgi:glycosyltransferase involved in cell wall biosynthesis
MISIIIPAYNEGSRIADVILKAKRYGGVIVVDDASNDNTAEIARKAGAKVISHESNRGLGSALRTGFKAALGASKSPEDIVITLDADGEHDPDDVPKFVAALTEGFEFALGKREIDGYPLRRRIGNFGLTFGTNLLCGTSLKDTESGFRAVRTDALRRMDLRARRYEIAAEIIHEVGRLRLRATNVPIKSKELRGKGAGVMDGLKNALYLFRRRFGLI